MIAPNSTIKEFIANDNTILMGMFMLFPYTFSIFINIVGFIIDWYQRLNKPNSHEATLHSLIFGRSLNVHRDKRLITASTNISQTKFTAGARKQSKSSLIFWFSRFLVFTPAVSFLVHSCGINEILDNGNHGNNYITSDFIIHEYARLLSFTLCSFIWDLAASKQYPTMGKYLSDRYSSYLIIPILTLFASFIQVFFFIESLSSSLILSSGTPFGTSNILIWILFGVINCVALNGMASLFSTTFLLFICETFCILGIVFNYMQMGAKEITVGGDDNGFYYWNKFQTKSPAENDVIKFLRYFVGNLIKHLLMPGGYQLYRIIVVACNPADTRGLLYNFNSRNTRNTDLPMNTTRSLWFIGILCSHVRFWLCLISAGHIQIVGNAALRNMSLNEYIDFRKTDIFAKSQPGRLTDMLNTRGEIIYQYMQATLVYNTKLTNNSIDNHYALAKYVNNGLLNNAIRVATKQNTNLIDQWPCVGVNGMFLVFYGFLASFTAATALVVMSLVSQIYIDVIIPMTSGLDHAREGDDNHIIFSCLLLGISAITALCLTFHRNILQLLMNTLKGQRIYRNNKDTIFYNLTETELLDVWNLVSPSICWRRYGSIFCACYAPMVLLSAYSSEVTQFSTFLSLGVMVNLSFLIDIINIIALNKEHQNYIEELDIMSKYYQNNNFNQSVLKNAQLKFDPFKAMQDNGYFHTCEEYLFTILFTMTLVLTIIVTYITSTQPPNIVKPQQKQTGNVDIDSKVNKYQLYFQYSLRFHALDNLLCKLCYKTLTSEQGTTQDIQADTLLAEDSQDTIAPELQSTPIRMMFQS